MKERQATGIASELRAAAYLTERGFWVFHALSGTYPFDLIAYRDGKFLRVEVKSCVVIGAERLVIPPRRNQDYDLLLAVSRKGRVFIDPIYRPGLGWHDSGASFEKLNDAIGPVALARRAVQESA